MTALALCDQIGEIRLATWLAPHGRDHCADQGDDEAARAIAERSVERAGDLEQMLLTAWALHGARLCGDAARRSRRRARWYEQYVPLVRETENGVAKLLILPHCADAFARAGRLDEAARLAAQAIALAEFAQGAAPVGVGPRACRATSMRAAARTTRRSAPSTRRSRASTELGSRLELARTKERKDALSKETR